MDRSEEATEIQPVESPPSRRDLLMKIGAALAASSAAIPALAGETGGRRGPDTGRRGRGMGRRRGGAGRAVQLPRNIMTSLEDVEPARQFSVFFARPRGSSTASLVIIDSKEQRTLRSVSRTLEGGSPARARVVDGIVQVSLGVKDVTRCTIDTGDIGLAAFNPSGQPALGPIRKGG